MLKTIEVDNVIQALEVIFPLSNPLPEESLAVIQRRAGQQDVLVYLNRILKEREDMDILNNRGRS